MVEAFGLSKNYVSRKRASHDAVFKDLQFKISDGEFVSFLGPSGCGKSTLLRILGGLDIDFQGKLQITEAKKAFVFQEPRLLPWRTCKENIKLPLEIQNSAISEDQINATLKLLNLEKAASQFPYELSGGMKMRTALARSLILNPQFLLLDEPFAALDETTRLFLQTELRSLFEKNRWTVAFVTHSIEEATYLSDRIFIFSKQRNYLVECIPQLPKQRPPHLREELMYFEETKKVRHLFLKEALV